MDKLIKEKIIKSRLSAFNQDLTWDCGLIPDSAFIIRT